MTPSSHPVLTRLAAALSLPFAAAAPAFAQAFNPSAPSAPAVVTPAIADALPAAPRPVQSKVRAVPKQAAEVELDAAPASEGSAAANPFGRTSKSLAVLPNAGSTLTAPVTLNANTAATVDALTSTQTGSGRALTGLINNANNTISAVKGQTNGSGAGVNGLNAGTKGPAGKFQITTAGSAQPSLVSTTAGTGNAVQGVVTNTAASSAAVLGQNQTTKGYGIGVEGDGGYIGVNASSPYYGVVGTGGSFGSYGYSSGGIGAYGSSSSSTGVYGSSYSSTGIRALSTSGYGLDASSSSSLGINVKSNSSYAIQANSGTSVGVRAQGGYIGVYGESNASSSYGVVGISSAGWAGYFTGKVYVTGPMYAQSYGSSSDRNLKQDIQPVDTGSVLDRIAAMPIASWDFKTQPGVHHIGPMAQDFHAAFGLGADDKHIDMVDGIGVSLAAIQELQRQSKQKDVAIEELSARVAQLQQLVETQLAARSTAAVVDASPAR